MCMMYDTYSRTRAKRRPDYTFFLLLSVVSQVPIIRRCVRHVCANLQRNKETLSIECATIAEEHPALGENIQLQNKRVMGAGGAGGPASEHDAHTHLACDL